MFSAQNLASIAGRASRLSERRDRNEPRGASDADEVVRIGARLDLWREEAAGTKPEFFARRLAWDAIPEENARDLLDDEWPLTSEPAEWLGFLGALRVSDRGGQSTGALEEPLDGSQIPFASAFRPFVAAALDLLVEAPSAPNDRLDPAILEAAARSLVAQLARLAAPVLARAFDEHLRVNGASADPSTSIHHDAFTAFFARREGWPDLLLEFPVLARLMATVCLGWARETKEFLTRLDADWGLIRSEFFPGIGIDEPFILKAVHSEVSDRHGGAGVVRVLEFSTGGRLVYKRRPLDLEADFNGLLRALGTQGLECAPPALRVFPRPGYGWVEHAEAAPVADAGALDLWFRKAGGLLCLMHLLGGNDGHMENVIATASGPILIDLETLMQPRLAQGAHASEGTFALAAQQVRSSVLQTGLLPLWQRGRYGKLYDIGGLTGAGGYESPVLRLSWENVGSDAVRAAWRRGFARGLANLPRLDETRHSAAGHLPALCAGFTETWRFLQANREMLGRMVSQWSAAPLRVLLRATTHYAAILERSVASKP